MAHSAHWIDPLSDPRWDEFLSKSPNASPFHTRAWLQAVHLSYGYDVLAFTTSHSGEELQNALPLCCVKSWLTGSRLVSVPFADHCEPLLGGRTDLQSFLIEVEQELRQKKMEYVELRPLLSTQISTALFVSTKDYCFHQLDLMPNLNLVFGRLHEDSTRRRIRCAQKEGLIYQEGQSEFLLGHFYRLFVLTCRRHGLPPQPQKWFRNLVECFGGALKIRVAFQGSRSVASILTLQYKNTLTYKYGCSDAQYDSLGGIQLLFWRSICEAKEQGLQTFDLGRSDSADTALITFKDRWGAARSTLTYSRYFAPRYADTSFGQYNSAWKFRAAKRVFTHMPNVILSATGRMLYKHIG
jgi:hypothetical protein